MKIVALEQDSIIQAQELASTYGFEYARDLVEELHLEYAQKGLSLVFGDQAMRGDYTDLVRRLQPQKIQTELLVRAVHGKKMQKGVKVLDATAGMGEDSFLLAGSGCEVTLLEYNPVIYALLEDTIKRAQAEDGLSSITSRMHPLWENSMEYLKTHLKEFDVIYLDPMFPEREKSGMIKKKFQFLQKLEAPEAREEELLATALDACPRKIVIKRPSKAPYLGGKKPTYTLEGPTIRFDCIQL